MNHKTVIINIPLIINILYPYFTLNLVSHKFILYIGN